MKGPVLEQACGAMPLQTVQTECAALRQEASRLLQGLLVGKGLTQEDLTSGMIDLPRLAVQTNMPEVIEGQGLDLVRHHFGRAPDEDMLAAACSRTGCQKIWLPVATPEDAPLCTACPAQACKQHEQSLLPDSPIVAPENTDERRSPGTAGAC